MNIILLSEAAKDLERVVHIARDGGPVMLFHEGRIVAELHPHKRDAEDQSNDKPRRSIEEVFRSMDEHRERGPKFTSAELDEFRRAGRRY